MTDVPISVPVVAQTIQLAIAPVFMLTAIGAFLSVITIRLGRVIDRARAIEASLSDEPALRALTIAELASLDRRMVLANRAVVLCVASALTVCVLIAMLFVSAVSRLKPDELIVALFIAALLFLISALTAFALEVRIAMHTIRVRSELIKDAPRPPGDLHIPR